MRRAWSRWCSRASATARRRSRRALGTSPISTKRAPRLTRTRHLSIPASSGMRFAARSSSRLASVSRPPRNRMRASLPGQEGLELLASRDARPRAAAWSISVECGVQPVGLHGRLRQGGGQASRDVARGPGHPSSSAELLPRPRARGVRGSPVEHPQPGGPRGSPPPRVAGADARGRVAGSASVALGEFIQGGLQGSVRVGQDLGGGTRRRGSRSGAAENRPSDAWCGEGGAGPGREALDEVVRVQATPASPRPRGPWSARSARTSRRTSSAGCDRT